MSRISIDVTQEEHQKLKALAALQGQSIKDYVLDRTLAAAKDTAEEKAVRKLESVLDERIRKAEVGKVSNRTVEEIFDEVHQELGV